jgi:hypothetical protein
MNFSPLNKGQNIVIEGILSVDKCINILYYHYMIRSTENNEKKFYLVQGSTWESVVESEDAIDAACSGLEEAFEEYGDKLMLGSCLLVTRITDLKIDEPEEVEIDLFYVPSILSDIGKTDLASQLDEILRNAEKKA